MLSKKLLIKDFKVSTFFRDEFSGGGGNDE
jgi:hypothetical protein